MAAIHFIINQLKSFFKLSRQNQLLFGLSGIVLVLIGLNLTLLRVADITTINPIADTHVDATSPTSNYGSATSVMADLSPIIEAYLKFDLSNYTDYEVDSAVIRLYLTDISTGSYNIIGVETSDWDEGAMTYNTRPLHTVTYGSIPVSTVNTWVEVDITQAVINHRGSLLSLAIVSNGTTNGIVFNSKENASNKPELVITGTPDAAPDPSSVVFTAVGDFGNNLSAGSNVNNMLAGMGAENPDFALGLGDFIYSNNTANVTPWCDNVKSKLGADTPFQIIAGNHDSGADNSDIITTETDTLRECVPSKVNNLTPGMQINRSAYGLEYYFDYPSPANPLMRVILVSPGLWGWTYNEGTANYNFVQDAILEARDTGRTNGAIPWIVVGHHKNCITNGTKGCEISQDLFNLMLGENLGPGGVGYGDPVDLILEGHEHTYHRSKHLKTNASTCATIQVGGYDADCVTGSGGSFVKDEGAILAIIGTGGVSLRSINSAADAETNYFEAWNATNESMPAGNAGAVGFGKFTVTETSMLGQFVSTNGVNYADVFSITKDGEVAPTPVPTIQTQDITLNPVADTYSRSTDPTGNFGNEDNLEVDGSPVEISYLKFDLTGITEDVLSAKVRVFVEESSINGQTYYLVEDTSWGETTLNWDNQPARSTVLGTQPDPNTDQWTEIDITDAVNTYRGSMFALAIENTPGPDAGDGILLTSREGLTNIPELVYVIEGESTPTPTPYIPTDGSTLIRGGTKFKGGVKIRGGKSAPVPTTYAVGDTGPAGGKVFYDKGGVSDGWQYLEAAPSDLQSGAGLQWGCRGLTITEADGAGIGIGKYNTQIIADFHDNTANFGGNNYYSYGGAYADIGCSNLNNGVVAAKEVRSYTLNGFNDWFLPSADELNILYQQRAVVGGFAATRYWSSTRLFATSARYRDFSDGADNINTRNIEYRIRPIRSF